MRKPIIAVTPDKTPVDIPGVMTGSRVGSYNWPLDWLSRNGAIPVMPDFLNDEDAEAVYIFPKRGEKYHSRGCTFLRAASTSTALSSSVRKKYKGCPLCHSSKAADGALVYYFPSDGEDYHLPGCPALQRNYIEIERGTALKRGYTACSKCGG